MTAKTAPLVRVMPRAMSEPWDTLWGVYGFTDDELVTPPNGMTRFEIHPRQVWPKEVRDFAPWLAENIGLLGQCLRHDMRIIGREKRVGDELVRADLVAVDDTGRVVIIETQMGRSDSRHLGQLLSYAAVEHDGLAEWSTEPFLKSRGLFVWVIADMGPEPPFRSEHLRAIDFYDRALRADGVRLVVVEATVESDWYPAGTATEDMPALPRLRMVDPARPGLPAIRRPAFPPLAVRTEPATAGQAEGIAVVMNDQVTDPA